MSHEEFYSKSLKNQEAGYAQDASSPIMSGIRHAPIGDANQVNQVARIRHGSPIFYALLQEMAEIHDKKSHDYADNNDPSGNYHFAGKMSQLFKNPDDAGFMGRLSEKLYRLANLENNKLVAKNENIEDTEHDLCVIMVLWMSDRASRRMHATKSKTPSFYDKV